CVAPHLMLPGPHATSPRTRRVGRPGLPDAPTRSVTTVSTVRSRASRAERLDLGGARVVDELAIPGRVNRDQSDLSVGVVVDAPAVALREGRHAEVRMSLAQELLAFCPPDPLWDVVEDREDAKG